MCVALNLADISGRTVLNATTCSITNCRQKILVNSPLQVQLLISLYPEVDSLDLKHPKTNSSTFGFKKAALQSF